MLGMRMEGRQIMTKRTMTIEGMHCHHCAMALRKSFTMVDGVSDAEVEVGKATVTFDESRVRDADLKKAVERAGYKIRDH